MLRRRIAREKSLQALFEVDVGKADVNDVMNRLKEDSNLGEQVIEFAEKLILGTRDQLDELDATIKEYATEWKIDRMPNVDRNILRMALFEIKNFPDIPLSVTINEAVELAKIYSTDDSGKFVNGVLGKIVASNPFEKVKD